MESPRVVVVGGGPAAAGAARTVAEAGEPVAVLTAEPLPPYDRTVLSKAALLAPDTPVPPLWQPGAPWLERVFCRTSTLVEALDPDAGVLTTDDGTTWAFERVVLATGAEPRRLVVPGATGPGVHHLRDATDAPAVAAALRPGGRLVVVGGGVIGLEVAAAGLARGTEVDVVEAGPRILGRGVPDDVAAWVAAAHTARGIRIHSGRSPQEVLREGGRVTGVHLSDDAVLRADAVVVGIGVRPRQDLATAAGLDVDDGILVDSSMRTSHPAVLAAGDAVRMRGPHGGRGVRLESYTAAGRQGEVAAEVALGSDTTFDDVPWTWSDQGEVTIQTMGVPPPEAHEELVGGPDLPVVLSVDADRRLLSVCGASLGPSVARVVRASTAAVAARAVVDVDAVRAVGGDVAALARLLRDLGRG